MLATIFLTSDIAGSICFILPNCLTMILRIIFTYHLIRKYFHKHQYTLSLYEIAQTLTILIMFSVVYYIIFIVVEDDVNNNKVMTDLDSSRPVNAKS